MGRPVQPEDEPAESQVAAVLAAGILLNLIDQNAAVAWADHLIEKTDAPPPWMIDLSLSQNLYYHEVIKMLAERSTGADPVQTCRSLFGFIPTRDSYTFEQAKMLARELYRIALHCLNSDWSYPLLCRADEIDDTFSLMHEGYYLATRDMAVGRTLDFLDTNRDLEIRRFIDMLRAKGF
jgi:hypothetical protein